VARACNYRLNPSTVVGATWQGEDLLFVSFDKGENEATIMRTSPPFSTIGRALYPVIDGYVAAFATDATSTGYASVSLARALDDIVAIPPQGAQ